MHSHIYQSIMRHVDLMDAINQESHKLIGACKQNDLEGIELYTENRSRMLNLLDQLQNQVESQANTLASDELDQHIIGILKAWFNDLNIWVEQMIQTDQLIIQELETCKGATTKEIASVFKSREGHRGYNLNSVKK